MLLRKEYITKEISDKFFPMLATDSPQYKFFIEVSALKIQGRKTVQSLHISAARERESDGMLFRELFLQVPCLRESLDKPMRQSQIDSIYFEAKTKLLNRAHEMSKMFPDKMPLDHPYLETLTKM